jgi:hypothetical protein
VTRVLLIRTIPLASVTSGIGSAVGTSSILNVIDSSIY